jgi:hypothetical protein
LVSAPAPDASAVGAIKPAAAQVHKPQAQFFRNVFRFMPVFPFLEFIQMLTGLKIAR